MKKLLLFLLLLLSACQSVEEKITISSEVSIPYGYELVAGSSYGKYSSHTTLYCENVETGKVFSCNDGIIGRQIVIPDGYKLIAVISFGQYGSHPTYYCKHLETDEVFICK